VFPARPQGPARASSKATPGFRIVNVTADTEANAVAQLVGEGYDNLCLTLQSVQGWAGYRVFDRDL